MIKRTLAITAAALAMLGAPAVAQMPSSPLTGPDRVGFVDFRKPILRDRAMQHNKEVFILNGCAYCHGVDLYVRNGEAADLLHDPVVASDTDGKLIIGVLKQGISETKKLSPMPQFSTLSERDMNSIATWIHYARMEGRFSDLMKDNAVGDATAGGEFYQKNCQSCHQGSSLASKVKAQKAADQKAYILKPAFLDAIMLWKVSDLTDKQKIETKAMHQHWLENYSPKDAADLVAYLKSVK